MGELEQCPYTGNECHVQECDSCYTARETIKKRISERTETHSCDYGKKGTHGDAIYRQDAVDALAKFVPYAIDDDCTRAYTDGLTDAYNLICNLPSAEPERKTGRWIRHPEQKNIYGGKCVECSECGEKYVVSHIEDEKYCRNCGAKMEVDECQK